MENLAIIATGQLRTFFTNDGFLQMVNRCKIKYENVLVVCVINPVSESDISNISIYLDTHNIQNIIINFSLHQTEYHNQCNLKFQNPKIEQMITKYFSEPKHAHIGLSDPKTYSYSVPLVQFYQLQVGIKALKEYINETNVKFDIICKTRFDSKYPLDFYPHMPIEDNIIQTVSFNKHNLNIIQNNMAKYNLTTFDDLITFNKHTRLQLPLGHIPIEHYGLSFGGMVCYNYQSLENIQQPHGITSLNYNVTSSDAPLEIQGQQLTINETPSLVTCPISNVHQYKNILYAFNDFFYFAKSDVFLKLESLFDEACLTTCDNQDLYNHYFCPESQLMIFCLNHKIDIIMYPECFYDSMVHR